MLKPGDNEQLILLHSQGYSDYEISRVLFLHSTTVRYRRKILGLKANYPRGYYDRSCRKLERSYYEQVY